MKTFRKTPLALAIAALVASPFALAGNGGTPEVEIDKEWDTEVDIEVEKDLDVDKDVDINTDVFAFAYVFGDAFAQAYIESNQVANDNYVYNYLVNNTALVDGSGGNASGNVGINVTAGDNNQQANDAALALADANFVFAMAEVDSLQTNSNQEVDNFDVANNAVVNNSVNGVSGNLGLNVSAGNNNQQHNALAASVNTSFGTYAEADVVGMQSSHNNDTYNQGSTQETVVRVPVRLAFSAEGTYEGDWQQTNNVYPEIWMLNNGGDPGHPCTNCSNVGHLDFDDEQDNGQFAGTEAGDILLSGTVSGVVPVVVAVPDPHVNNAVLAGSLRNASGNVGVNIAAGTGNQQRNALAISAAVGGNGNGNGGEL